MVGTVVVGGGIVGASVAYHLAREGDDVLLVDRDDAGRATDAGAGIVSVATSSYEPPAVHRFAIEAARYYPELVGELERSVDDAGFDRPGLLTVATGEERSEFTEFRERVLANQRRTGHPPGGAFAEIDPDEAAALFPALGDVRDVLYYPEGGRVDGRKMNRALLTAGEAAGLETLSASVESIASSGGSVEGIVADGEEFPASRVVVTGGAWSSAFADALGVTIPVEPQRGQIACLHTDEDDVDWPMVKGFRDHYMVPWPDGRVSAGATRESRSGFAPHTTAAGVRTVLDEVLRLAPGLADAALDEVRVGLRPLCEDGRPVIGEAPLDGAFLATGHGPSGLTLGPYSGKVVADAVLGREGDVDLSPFAPDRFD